MAARVKAVAMVPLSVSNSRGGRGSSQRTDEKK